MVASILACYAGGIEKTLYPESGQRICMLGDHLLQAKVVLPEEVAMSEVMFTSMVNLIKFLDMRLLQLVKFGTVIFLSFF